MLPRHENVTSLTADWMDLQKYKQLMFPYTYNPISRDLGTPHVPTSAKSHDNAQTLMLFW